MMKKIRNSYWFTLNSTNLGLNENVRQIFKPLKIEVNKPNP